MSETPAEYEIRDVKILEWHLIVPFLQKHFFPHEYLLSTYLKSAKNKFEESQVNIINEELQRDFQVLVAKVPRCVVAVEKNSQKIVGVGLLTIEPRNEPEESKNCVKATVISEWFKYVLEPLDKRFNFFEKFPSIESLLRIEIMCVDGDHGKKGLATSFLRDAVSYARDKGVDLVSGIFTSPYSKRAAEKIGFQAHGEIDARSFMDSNGKPIYTEPHISTIMAVQLK